jgi:hypothetical protein
MRGERDLPEGHPSASDYDPNSKAAKRYAARMTATASNRDWPLDHPGAADNPNRVEPTHPLETTRDYSRPDTVILPTIQPADPLLDEA